MIFPILILSLILLFRCTEAKSGDIFVKGVSEVVLENNGKLVSPNLSVFGRRLEKLMFTVMDIDLGCLVLVDATNECLPNGYSFSYRDWSSKAKIKLDPMQVLEHVEKSIIGREGKLKDTHHRGSLSLTLWNAESLELHNVKVPIKVLLLPLQNWLTLHGNRQNIKNNQEYEIERVVCQDQGFITKIKGVENILTVYCSDNYTFRLPSWSVSESLFVDCSSKHGINGIKRFDTLDQVNFGCPEEKQDIMFSCPHGQVATGFYLETEKETKQVQRFALTCQVPVSDEKIRIQITKSIVTVNESDPFILLNDLFMKVTMPPTGDFIIKVNILNLPETEYWIEELDSGKEWKSLTHPKSNEFPSSNTNSLRLRLLKMGNIGNLKFQLVATSPLGNTVESQVTIVKLMKSDRLVSSTPSYSSRRESDYVYGRKQNTSYLTKVLFAIATPFQMLETILYIISFCIILFFVFQKAFDYCIKVGHGGECHDY